MAKYKVIMDCDPGDDDTVALLTAMGSRDEIDILGITTVAGNVELEYIQRNARCICDLANRQDLKVYAGCQKPMIREPFYQKGRYGKSGLGSVVLPDPKMPLQKSHAVDFIISTLMEAKDKVILLPTAPLTNIALAILKEPRIINSIDRIILMGGSIGLGNVTPGAEFNMLGDPHAASIVFASGAPIVMIGLDVTHKVLATSDRIAAIQSIGNKPGEVVASLLRFSSVQDQKCYGLEGRAVHDVCVVAYLLQPNLFSGKNAHVKIGINEGEGFGRTYVSWYNNHLSRVATNAWVAESADANGIFNMIQERLSKLS